MHHGREGMTVWPPHIMAARMQRIPESMSFLFVSRQKIITRYSFDLWWRRHTCSTAEDHCRGLFSLLPPCGALRANSDDQKKEQTSFPLGHLISSLPFHSSCVTSHAQDGSSSLVRALKCPHRHYLLGDSKSRQTGSEDQPWWLWFSISQPSGHF